MYNKMILKYVVIDNKYSNINSILKEEFNISNRLFVKLLNSKMVLLNGKNVDTRTKLNKNDVITVNLNLPEDNSNIVSKHIPLNILYEDNWLLILDKPAGIAVHPSLLHYDDSLSSGVKYYFDNINLKKKIRPINRLDYNTSGIVLFAKSEYIQEILSKQMQDNLFKKEYLCVIDGILEEKSGILNFPIARKDNSIIERCVSLDGKPSITRYSVIEEFKTQNFSLIKCSLETGRTHQIRVHFSHIGHPLIGDTLYGDFSTFINRQALHSYKVSFIHPITKKELTIISPLAEDIKKIIKQSKSVSRVLSSKIVIYLEYTSLYISSHAIQEGVEQT